MKRNIFFYNIQTALLLICTLSVLTSCKSKNNEDMIWDLIPYSAKIYVLSPDGKNLLNEESKEHLNFDEITLLFNGETYSLKTEKTRYYLPKFYGLELRKDADGAAYLYVGEFDSAQTANIEFEIDWGNQLKEKDHFKINNILTGSHHPKTTYYVNGKKQKNARIKLQKDPKNSTLKAAQ